MMEIEWVDIEKQAPPDELDGEDILIMCENGMVFSEPWFRYGFHYGGNWKWGSTEIKYWARLKEHFANLPKAHYKEWRRYMEDE